MARGSRQIRKGDPSSVVVEKIASRATGDTATSSILGAGYRTPGRPVDSGDGAGVPDTNPKTLAIRVETSPGVFQTFAAEVITLGSGLTFLQETGKPRGTIEYHPMADVMAALRTR